MEHNVAIAEKLYDTKMCMDAWALNITFCAQTYLKDKLLCT